MNPRRSLIHAALFALGALAACDKDPNAPDATFATLNCLTTRIDVNAPIAIGFNRRIAPSTVTGANVVVSNAVTGVEFPGSLSTNSARGGDTIFFTPAAPLPFDTLVQVRVQNILAAEGNIPAPQAVCDLRTVLPPIQELFWNQLPSAPGTLNGVSLVTVDTGYVSAAEEAIFRSVNEGPFALALTVPYFSTATDVSFATSQQGFTTQFDSRHIRGVVVRTRDGGVTFDTLFSVASQVLQRVIALPNGANDMFAIVGAGQSTGTTSFYKYHPESSTFTGQIISTGTGGNATGNVTDLDFFPADTVNGAASTFGLQVSTINSRGMLYVTSNGGTTWDSIPGSRASDATVTYTGVGIRGGANQIFVTGGSGTLRRFTKTGPLAYTVTDYPLSAFGITNPDPTNPQALIFTDVEFLPSNDQIGWLIGARQQGVVNGTPKYNGLIFITRDGGATWTRQGVRGAPSFGAEMPRLNRISVLRNQTGQQTPKAWIIGDGGFVISYQP